jgi:hypothetical protein
MGVLIKMDKWENKKGVIGLVYRILYKRSIYYVDELPKKTIEEKCIWKKMEEDNGTTFQGVKKAIEEGYPHPLKKCIPCDGHLYSCGGYKILK